MSNYKLMFKRTITTYAVVELVAPDPRIAKRRAKAIIKKEPERFDSGGESIIELESVTVDREPEVTTKVSS